MDVCPNRRQLLESFRTVQFDARGPYQVRVFGQVSSTIGRLYLANGSDDRGVRADAAKIRAILRTRRGSVQASLTQVVSFWTAV
jgi:hypothetical protein